MMEHSDLTVLGESGSVVRRVGFGGCPLGGHGWGKVEEDELINAVKVALELGIDFFDTADVYGLGRSEELLARGLDGSTDRRIIATKAGVRFDRDGRTFYDNSPEWLQEALEGSLRRLRTSTIDLYQVHYWDGRTPVTDLLERLQRFRDEGKIRYFGVSNIDLIEHGVTAPVDGLVSVSFEYSLAQPKYSGTISEHVQRLGTSFLSWGSLGQGILTGKYGSGAKFGVDDRRSREVYVNFRGEQLERNMGIVAALRELAQLYPNQTVANLAVRWILDATPRSIALVGVKTVAQVRENAGALGWRLADEHVEYLRALVECSPERVQQPQRAGV